MGDSQWNKEDPAAKSWTQLKAKIREVFLVDLTSAERKKLRMQLKQEPGEHPLDFLNGLTLVYSQIIPRCYGATIELSVGFPWYGIAMFLSAPMSMSNGRFVDNFC